MVMEAIEREKRYRRIAPCLDPEVERTPQSSVKGTKNHRCTRPRHQGIEIIEKYLLFVSFKGKQCSTIFAS